MLLFFMFWRTAEGQVRINEVRSNDDSSDDIEFIELIGIAGTDLSGYEIYHVNGNGDSEIFTHTIGAFVIPDDGVTDSEANALGFYVLGAGDFSSGADESISSSLQGGPDGIILYDESGNVIDAVAWGGVGDISNDITTSGSPEADNYLHEIGSDSDNDNSLQAPNNVVGDNGSGWTYEVATVGSINASQTNGSIVIISSLKTEPANHVTSFTATGSVNSVGLTWTDASGTPSPDAYLIKVSDIDFGSISNPSDTNTEPNDTDLSDGSGALNVNSGEESASFSGLNETTTYYFKIFSYTNTGSDIDYKTDSAVPQSEATTLDTPDIVLNEFLADPDGDANGDGSTDSDDDEFLEFVNTGTADLDISDWTIEDSNSTTHTFENPTVLKPNQAVLVFGGGTPTGKFGGAIVQTTGSLSLNNSGDDIILKNNSGIEIIRYTYGGTEGSSNQSFTRSPDLTGNFTDHSTADTHDGSPFSPGTRIGGFPFHPWLEITGTEGWRMLSTPTSNNSYDDLLGSIWTQGSSTGANYSGGAPTVVTYDGTTFNAVDDLTGPMDEGEGVLVFVYSDDNHTESEANSGFPKILEMAGTENSGTVTPSIHSGSGGEATLVGNPYLSPVDWDLLDKNNLTNTVYVYDHSYGTPIGSDVEASEVAGSYRVWNGSSGSLNDGRIAPFQGFWVITDAAGSASLTIEESDKIIGGTFYKEKIDEAISIHLKAETDKMFNEAFFSFNKTGQPGMDSFDGLELTPLDHDDYLSLSTETEGILLDINNLPIEFTEALEIPLHVNAFQAVDEGWTTISEEVSLTWPELKNIPIEWSLILKDNQTGKTVNLKETDSYKFLSAGSSAKIADKKPFHPLIKNPLQREKAPPENRFTLTIYPDSKNSTNNDIPDRFALRQNYPNPFNPTTNIDYEIAVQSDVELSIFNVMGQKVATLVSESKAPGSYAVTWNAFDMASGVYYYQLNVSGVVYTRQMTLIK